MCCVCVCMSCVCVCVRGWLHAHTLKLIPDCYCCPTYISGQVPPLSDILVQTYIPGCGEGSEEAAIALDL